MEGSRPDDFAVFLDNQIDSRHNLLPDSVSYTGRKPRKKIE
jgi:hypothetical protein